MSQLAIAASPPPFYSHQIQRCDAAWAALHEKVWECFLSFLTLLGIESRAASPQTFLMMTTENLPDGQFCWRWDKCWLAVTSFAGSERAIIEKAFRIRKQTELCVTVTVPSFSEAFQKLGLVPLGDIMFLDDRAIGIWNQIIASNAADKEALYESLQTRPKNQQSLAQIESTHEFYLQYTIDPLNRCITIDKLLAPSQFIGLAIESVFRKSQELGFEGQIKIKLPVEDAPEYLTWGFLPDHEASQDMRQMEQMASGLFSSMLGSGDAPKEEELEARMMAAMQSMSAQCSLSPDTFGMWNEILSASDLQQKQAVYGKLWHWAQKTVEQTQQKLAREMAQIPGFEQFMQMFSGPAEDAAEDRALLEQLMSSDPQEDERAAVLAGMKQACLLQGIILDPEQGSLVVTDLSKIQASTFRDGVTAIMEIGKKFQASIVKIDIFSGEVDDIAVLGFVKDTTSSAEGGKVRYVIASWAQSLWANILNAENTSETEAAYEALSIESALQLSLLDTV